VDSAREGWSSVRTFHFDDGLGAARTVKEADALVDLVKSLFEIRKRGEPVDFLRIEIQRNQGAGTITISQMAKADALAAAHGEQGACRTVPMSPECFSTCGLCNLREPMADKLSCQKVIGSLLHLAQCARPDMALSAGGACGIRSLAA
jgi:hypothetical protein